MTTFFTPLRYPGGKGRMGPWISELLRYNGISVGIMWSHMLAAQELHCIC